MLSISCYYFDEVEVYEKTNARAIGCLLYTSFKENGIKYTHSHGDGIPIHHVHGFLPQESEVSLNRRIVFSEDEYHKPVSYTHLDVYKRQI